MFNRIRNRLTVLNAAVLFIILACIGLIVYCELRHQLYAKVDESLRTRAQDLRSVNVKAQFFTEYNPASDDKSMKKSMILIQGIDPRVFLVLWDESGKGIPLMLGTDNGKTAEAFRPYRPLREPETVKIDGHYYRLYTLDYDQPVSMNVKIMTGQLPPKEGDILPPYPSDDGEAVRIVSAQAVSIVDSEQNMLNILLEIMLLGIFGGGALTVLAGLYLANKALQPIRRSWDRQQQFVADASHELRMPLSIIQANAELVFRHPDRSILDMSEPLSMVLAEAKRMGKLTNQLLTLARADSNQEELQLKPLGLDSLIREAARKFEPLTELKRQRLELQVESGLQLMGDSERLHQLLVILLDNSVKFTPEQGTIRLRAGRSGHSVEVAVEDNGPGIAAEDLPRIFDRFYRGDKARTRSSGGTGLGLSIAWWIVVRHGGHITAASVPGQGTIVTFRLPVKHKN
ncbi:HAMP domain-containing histidine kinase [Paenibacillus doosanensis]|uniref:sensor histidine kinase n=1 Tax=Paenibacillus doosanensis TaxID=1229154 RepID=UPI00217F8276|nr:HAMP domain-containing sensor histidine kinase [Paenibacillus doosanensis]MCS7463137.1 HAMP domain-containing histidine kinase [Paenibacillus doosanensis]